MDIWHLFASRLQAIEHDLDSRFRAHTESVPAELVIAMRYSLMSPGKRLRPLLVVLACEAAGGTITQALPAATAVEMVHTYSLIHDDLPAMDDDDLRRGRPTCHKQYGEALAILAGDGLLTLAFEVIAQSYTPSVATVNCLELARGAGAMGMVGGQVLDLIGDGRIVPHDKSSTLSDNQTLMNLEDLHRRKTGALFRSSLRMGAHSAASQAAKPDVLTAIDDYANAFGLAFQVTDDLLDVESSTEKTGKRVGKDAQRGKVTYPGLIGIEASRDKARELGEQAMRAARRLGRLGQPLAELADYVVNRDR